MIFYFIRKLHIWSSDKSCSLKEAKGHILQKMYFTNRMWIWDQFVINSCHWFIYMTGVFYFLRCSMATLMRPYVLMLCTTLYGRSTACCRSGIIGTSARQTWISTRWDRSWSSRPTFCIRPQRTPSISMWVGTFWTISTTTPRQSKSPSLSYGHTGYTILLV